VVAGMNNGGDEASGREDAQGGDGWVKLRPRTESAPERRVETNPKKLTQPSDYGTMPNFASAFSHIGPSAAKQGSLGRPWPADLHRNLLPRATPRTRSIIDTGQNKKNVMANCFPLLDAQALNAKLRRDAHALDPVTRPSAPSRKGIAATEALVLYPVYGTLNQ
jgi:hypothetical protein